MKAQIKVTNKRKFRGVEVEAQSLQVGEDSATGQIRIEKDGKIRAFDGEHSLKDYALPYGFIIQGV